MTFVFRSSSSVINRKLRKHLKAMLDGSQCCHDFFKTISVMYYGHYGYMRVRRCIVKRCSSDAKYTSILETLLQLHLVKVNLPLAGAKRESRCRCSRRSSLRRQTRAGKIAEKRRWKFPLDVVQWYYNGKIPPILTPSSLFIAQFSKSFSSPLATPSTAILLCPAPQYYESR